MTAFAGGSAGSPSARRPSSAASSPYAPKALAAKPTGAAAGGSPRSPAVGGMRAHAPGSSSRARGGNAVTWTGAPASAAHRPAPPAGTPPRRSRLSAATAGPSSWSGGTDAPAGEAHPWAAAAAAALAAGQPPDGSQYDDGQRVPYAPPDAEARRRQQSRPSSAGVRTAKINSRTRGLVRGPPGPGPVGGAAGAASGAAVPLSPGPSAAVSLGLLGRGSVDSPLGSARAQGSFSGARPRPLGSDSLPFSLRSRPPLACEQPSRRELLSVAP